MFRIILKDLNLSSVRIGQPRALTSLRNSYVTYQNANNCIDLVLLSANMGARIQMILKHYGHLETVQQTVDLVGR